eukprot:TRINITY_DN4246_c0_g1_i1.p1 TRINITY_DN4246_c0_g1~~TRINITY_DN4246_c0_g1_i1.p1  ORF type:complete len:217 (+),score=71.99 TRINITY_DN4246_c0_g1_i1:102-752(+)
MAFQERRRPEFEEEKLRGRIERERFDRGRENYERVERGPREERGERGERPERGERGERVERDERRERERERDRGDREREERKPEERKIPAGIEKKPFVVDREKTCPLLLRIFFKRGGHQRSEDFSFISKEPEDESQIYTWRDATLREITELIKEVKPEVRKRDVRLLFALVFPDKRGKAVIKEVGQVISTKKGEDDQKSLHDLHFEVGDYLDVAII